MAKRRTVYVCQACGHRQPKWGGRCPSCGEWNVLVEEPDSPGPAKTRREVRPEPLTAGLVRPHERLSSGSLEFDRTLGGGVVPGSLVLLGGDPGIGKSTLLLQVCGTLAHRGLKVLYVTGEESLEQTALRAQRLGISTDNLLVLPETDIDVIEDCFLEVRPTLLVVDSIQTVYDPALGSAPGGVGQVRECAARLLRLAKSGDAPVFLVGHVTKTSTIAGPRALEHMVDTVLYFEGDANYDYRILRAVKNRFGATNELGIFRMTERGLVDVANPSELFINRAARGVPGSVVTATMEGTRPLLVEIQSLLTPGYVSSPPRRVVSGVDASRVSLLMAVLDRRAGLHLQGHDAFIKLAGGVKIQETAIDLALALAIASSFKERAIPRNTVVIGEVGLAGEVRPVSRMQERVREATRLGFTQLVMPAASEGIDGADLRTIPVSTIAEALDRLL
mgnify:CR=1 FL=1